MYLIMSTFNISQVGSTRVKQRLTLFTSAKTWNEAKSVCESGGMRMLQIESQAKSITVDKFLSQWGGSINGDLWIGLHEVDEEQPQIVQWTDCNVTQYQDFASPPSATADDTFCYSLTSVGLNWKPARCDTVLQFICETNIGLCDFDRSYPATGCSWSDKESADVAIAPCHSLCLDGVWPDAKECWAIGFWDGYAGNDCWMFYSYDPDACVGNTYSHNSIVLYYKTCYVDDVNTTPVVVPSDTGIYPRSQCFVQKTTTISITDPMTTVAMETTPQDTTITSFIETTTKDTTITTVASETTPQDTTITSVAMETTPQDTTITSVAMETTTKDTTIISVVETTPPDTTITSVAMETTPQDITSSPTSLPDISLQEDTTTAPTGQDTTVETTWQKTTEPITTWTGPSSEESTMALSSKGQVTTSVQTETSPSISDSTILVHESSTKEFNHTHFCKNECLCESKQLLTLEQLQALLNDLSIDKKQTSNHKRRFYSPGDERTSARSIGYAGAIFLGISFGGIVLLDVQVLFKHFKLRFNQTHTPKGHNVSKSKRDSVERFNLSGEDANC